MSFVLENEGLECYFCASDDHNYGDCDAEHGGDVVHCQTEDKEAPHYGHTCAVGHTGNYQFKYFC